MGGGFNPPVLDLNIIIDQILRTMYKVVEVLMNIQYTWNGFTFNAFNFTLAAFCLAKIITIIFGEFIDTDTTDEMYDNEPID